MSQMLKFMKADWAHQMWGKNMMFLLFMICAFIAVPIIYNLIIYFLAKMNRIQMGKTFGNNSQVVIGSMGNIIHEAETLVLGRLGGHNLHNVHFISLNDFKHFRNTISTDHNWATKNLYQAFFDYLIGLAPAYITAVILWGVQTLLGGNMYHYSNSVHVSTFIHSFFRGLNTAFSGGNILESILYFIIVIVVASTAFSSTRDALRRGYSGISVWLIAIVLVWIVLVFSTFMMSALPLVWGFTTLSAFLLGHVLVYLIVILVLVCIFTGLNKL